MTKRAEAMLAGATLAAVSIAVVTGVLRAQTLPPAPAYGYDAVSIHKSAPGQTSEHFGKGPAGGLQTSNTSLMSLLTFAYDVRDYQFADVPGWVSSERYDITLTPDRPETTVDANTSAKEALAWVDRSKQRVQAVLRDRFGLVLRSETRELPIYLLVQAGKGAKVTQTDGAHPVTFHNNGHGHVESLGSPIKVLADYLSSALSRPVTDKTGLTGVYDFKLDWTPDPSPSDASNNTPLGASIFTALTDQLGLRLESAKGPVQVYVVEKIEHPTEN